MNQYVGQNSGQIVNKAKSSVYLGKCARARAVSIRHILGIREGSLPFMYLGVPVFQGRPRMRYFQSIADKVRNKLSSWKGRLLSQAARGQLISSVIQGILVYSFQIYEWPSTLLKKVQGWMRNFFWSGDCLKRGSTLVAWSDCCLPKKEGGLGLKNIFSLNRSLLLKRCWDMASGDSPSSIFLRNRFLKCGLQPKKSYQMSSVWLGLKK